MTNESNRELVRDVPMSSTRPLAIWCALGALAGALACRSPAPVAPAAPPPAVPTAEAAPPPPPPPKCESLEESCKAASDTELELADTALSFAPPEGWTYAREDGFSVTIAPGGTATLALTAAPSDARTPVVEAVEKLLARLEIEDVNTRALRNRLGKSDGQLDNGKLTIRLWEVDKRRQHGKSPQLKGKGQGTLLVVLAPARDGKVVVGAGFVVTPDSESLASVVMKSIQSLRTTP
jgi:hypothetical protein